MPDTAKSPLVRVGRLAGAFGVKGEVRITAYTEEPKTLLAFKTLLQEDGSPGLTLQSGRSHKDSVIARVAEITTPEQADARRGLNLYVPRASLPEPDEDEFYLTDLFGLAAVSPDGKPLGVVKTVRDFGAGDVLEIQPANGASWWVAFTRETVPEVKIAEGRIVVVRPAEISEKEAGL
jgi:16S rRNA processing protein RimM